MHRIQKALLAAAFVLPLCVPAGAFAQGPPPGPQGAPPPPIRERIGPRPYPDGYYVRGHYAWTGGRYVWTPGGWQHRPRPYARYVPGHWRRGPGGWVWIDGRWR